METINVVIDSDLEDLIPSFLERRKADLTEGWKTLQTGNFPRLQRIAHNFKGTSGCFGFDGLSEIGKALEQAAKDEDYEIINRQLHAFEEYLSSIKLNYR